MPDKRVKATFYLPLKDNAGRALGDQIAEVENRCFVAFGAWTLAGYFKGAWRMRTGERKLDTSAVYSVVLEPDRLDELESILKDFKARADQEAVYLEVEHDVDMRLL